MTKNYDQTKIRWATEDDRIATLEALVQLVNTAYTVAERGLVQPGEGGVVWRLTVDQARRHVQRMEMIVLLEIHCQENNDSTGEKLCGCVTVQKLDDEANVGEWGCLAVHPDAQGKGYRRQLVEAAEEALIRNHACSTLQLLFLNFAHTLPEYHSSVPLSSSDRNDTAFRTEETQNNRHYKERMARWYTQTWGYIAQPTRAKHFPAHSSFAHLHHMHVYLAADATLTPFRKHVSVG